MSLNTIKSTNLGFNRNINYEKHSLKSGFAEALNRIKCEKNMAKRISSTFK